MPGRFWRRSSGQFSPFYHILTLKYFVELWIYSNGVRKHVDGFILRAKCMLFDCVKTGVQPWNFKSIHGIYWPAQDAESATGRKTL